MLKYLIRGTIFVTLSIIITGCTNNIDYVYNDALAKKGFIPKDVLDKENEKARDNLFYIPKQLGGIKFKDDNAPEGERVFLIRREKSSIIAETQVYEGKDYKYFDRAYFSAGASTSDYVGLQLRLEDDENKLFEKAIINVGANKKNGRVGLEMKFTF
jgi:hypothetical protein